MTNLLSPKISITAQKLGNEGEPLAIVDNFFESVDKLVEVARTRPFSPAANYYPGLRSAAPNQYLSAVHTLLQDALSEIFQFEKDQVLSIDSAISMVTRRPEDLSEYQRIPHFDRPQREGLACVHYLFPAELPYGGTSFYRHNSTGYEFIDENRVETYQETLKTEFSEIGLPEPPAYINGDTNMFTRYASCEGIYNRALFYRASSLHSGNIFPDHNYDAEPAQSRLTMTSFIKLK